MRLIDVLASSIGLMLLSPLLLVVAVAVRFSSTGPVFFLGSRIGKHGNGFKICKFRTMVEDASRSGPGITSAHDSRVTKLGAFLRRTKIDELPQLYNVLKGEMSLVGPRPEDPRFVEYYDFDQRKILDATPGITSLASLTYRREQELLSGPNWEQTYINDVMPQKLRIDLEYMAKRSLLSDMGIIARTILGLGPP